MKSAPPRIVSALLRVLLLCLVFPGGASSYTLEFSDKWGTSFFQTFGPVSSTPGGPSSATVTWSYIADGAGIDTTHYTDGTLDGVSHIGSLRSAIDGKYGTGAFDAAVARAFTAWANSANLTFDKVTDNGAVESRTTAVNAPARRAATTQFIGS